MNFSNQFYFYIPLTTIGSELMMKFIFYLITTILFVACNSTNRHNNSTSNIEFSYSDNSKSLKDTINRFSKLSGTDSFRISSFGDNIYVLSSKDRPNGYEISIFKSDDLYIWHLKKENLDRYIATHAIPYYLEIELQNYLEEKHHPVNEDNNGVYYTNFSEYIPIEDYLGIGFSFVDVNFDGEEEFVVEHDAYHLHNYYYVCFDLVNGSENAYPRFLSPMRGDVYENLTQGTRSITSIDHAKKEIHIIAKIGNADIIETRAKRIESEVKIVERIEYVNYSFEKSKTTYKLQNDTLKKVAYETFDDKTFFENLCAKYSFD